MKAGGSHHVAAKSGGDEERLGSRKGHGHLGWGADRAQGVRGRPAEGCGGWASL